MGVTSSNKLVNVDRIDCNGTVKVTIALSAAPDITTNPTDIVLVLDRSGSMTGDPLANMKDGANTFIDIIDTATDGTPDGEIGSGSRIGLVSFATSATADVPLTTSVSDLKSAVNALNAGGQTNHAEAFAKAIQLFDPLSSNAKVIVMFTDGKTTIGQPPAPVAASARAAGIIIYCIGLIGEDGIDVDALNDWATDPDASHVVVTPDDAQLEDLFADLAANISKTGATDIVIDEIVNPDFAITSILQPNKGTATMINSTTIKWSIKELGVTSNEGATLEFYIQHISDMSGEKLVNESISYLDAEGNVVVFPAPKVNVECEVIVDPEPCPKPVEFSVDECNDTMYYDAGDVTMQSLGRMVTLSATVKNMCPGRRVALAAMLTEVDAQGVEYPRGMKAMTLPAHDYPTCRDVKVKSIRFVLPEDLDVMADSPDAICNARNLKARFVANYIDGDSSCSDVTVVLQ